MAIFKNVNDPLTTHGKIGSGVSFPAVILFIFLWIYLFVRAIKVFPTHDEITSMWAYMVVWMPLPYQGYIDANNHFLNSLLGGFFLRLFHSDAPLVIRLPNLLAFPLFFWSLYSMRKFFHHRATFYVLLVGLGCSVFPLEFFAMARGYGLSSAFMVFAIYQSMQLHQKQNAVHLVFAVVSWVLAVYASLTLIPFAAAGFVWLGIEAWRLRRKAWILMVFAAIYPYYEAIRYSFFLKETGRLYYGGKEGFITDTLHTLTPHLWQTTQPVLDTLLIILGLFIIAGYGKFLWQTKDLFNLRLIFPAFFVLSLANIFGQHFILGINFPSDRAALYLVIFFFGGLAFILDHYALRRPSYIMVGILLIYFFRRCRSAGRRYSNWMLIRMSFSP
ncbi:MAG: hypothetical protein KDD36_09610 [Flavobacteriales bacterium]|nr:hypothetical protein [Flavobacteriales bacterium]